MGTGAWPAQRIRFACAARFQPGHTLGLQTEAPPRSDLVCACSSYGDRRLASAQEGLPLTGLREGSLAIAASMMLPADLELFFLPDDSPTDESSASDSPAAQPGTPVKDNPNTAEAPCKELEQSDICIPGAWGECFPLPFLSSCAARRSPQCAATLRRQQTPPASNPFDLDPQLMLLLYGEL